MFKVNLNSYLNILLYIITQTLKSIHISWVKICGEGNPQILSGLYYHGKVISQYYFKQIHFNHGEPDQEMGGYL